MEPERRPFVHGIAVVVPVYQGEGTLDGLIDELRPLTEPRRTPGGRLFQVAEIVLVYDHGPDRSNEVIRRLARSFDRVRPVWLSRNYGQHAATLAGMASTSADWIATVDEDGQHDPADLPRMLDSALDRQVSLVYGEATNRPPHGRARNAASASARWLANSIMTSNTVGQYTSYRLIVGGLGRAVAAYGGQDIHLDVALSWVVPASTSCPVELRHMSDRPSGFGFHSLLSRFLRLVVTSGTRPLRVVAVTGSLVSFTGFGLAIYFVYARLVRDVTVEGWTSVAVIVLTLSGVILFAVGVIAEYLGVAVRMAMGRPPYLIVGDPQDGPLARAEPTSVRDSVETAVDAAPSGVRPSDP